MMTQAPVMNPEITAADRNLVIQLHTVGMGDNAGWVDECAVPP